MDLNMWQPAVSPAPSVLVMSSLNPQKARKERQVGRLTFPLRVRLGNCMYHFYDVQWPENIYVPVPNCKEIWKMQTLQDFLVTKEGKNELWGQFLV